ncbi:MAG TPA: metallophosphoesterase [Patescibacteria group bacterium]|nr:metallophosphoesterase [Patescibacteria group bacterium]
MTTCLFVSDLHGRIDRYRKLFRAIATERPEAVFIGGDILPHHGRADIPPDFINGFFLRELARLHDELDAAYPRVFVILGNDDERAVEPFLATATARELITYMHGTREPFGRWSIYGYACVPPTPFRLKDWERYDVSRFIDPGCISPEEGARTVHVPSDEVCFGTIARDLEVLAGSDDLTDAVFLFHAPPYRTELDRAPLDNICVDHVPLDVHIGSIAVRRFIESSQPLLTLHGHAHESARLTGAWRDRLGRTIALSAAHDGPELALVKFDLEDPESAVRMLQ